MNKQSVAYDSTEEVRIFSETKLAEGTVRIENRQERRARQRREAKVSDRLEKELKQALGSKAGSGKSRTNRRGKR